MRQPDSLHQNERKLIEINERLINAQMSEHMISHDTRKSFRSVRVCVTAVCKLKRISS